MKKIIWLSLSVIAIIGCNHKTEKFPHDIDIAFFKENDIVFRNDEFKNLLDDLVRRQPTNPSNGYNSVLVYLSLYKNDTLMVLMSCPPFEKEELKAYHYYNSYRIHFYAPKELEKKLGTFIKYDKIHRVAKYKMKIEMYPNLIYQAPYLVNGSEIELFNIDEKSMNEIFSW